MRLLALLLIAALAACYEPTAPARRPCSQPSDFVWVPVVDAVSGDTITWAGYCYTGGKATPLP